MKKMKKTKTNLVAIGFADEEKIALMCLNRFNEYEPFEKKGKLGVRMRYGKSIVIEPAFTYIEVFSINYDVFFIVGNEEKYGLYQVYGIYDCEVKEIIPIDYKQIDTFSRSPKIFCAYTDIDQSQFDVYWGDGLLAKGCVECVRDYTDVKVKYINGEQELFHLVGDYYTETIIPKGKHDIQLYNGYIIVEGEKTVVYNCKGHKVSEDVSGTYVEYGDYLVHITENTKKFYNRNGEEVNLRDEYEDVVETEEYVLVKRSGHWKVVYSV